MPQRSFEIDIRRPTVELQQSKWCSIGIHAVAAASLYSDHGPRHNDTPPPMVSPDRQSDFATD